MVVKIEKKPLKNNRPWMMVSPQRGLRRKLFTDAFLSKVFSRDKSAMKAPPVKSKYDVPFTANYLPSSNRGGKA
jgi:hypothetical protein